MHFEGNLLSALWKTLIFMILEVLSHTVGKVYKLLKPTEISFNFLISINSNLRDCNLFYNKHKKKQNSKTELFLRSKQRLITAALLMYFYFFYQQPEIPLSMYFSFVFLITHHLQMNIGECVLTLAPLECLYLWMSVRVGWSGGVMREKVQL